jgi:hypothetical protein
VIQIVDFFLKRQYSVNATSNRMLFEHLGSHDKQVTVRMKDLDYMIN